mgnify:CR=1 FL=1
MQEFDYFRPGTIRELKEKLAIPGARILAGGTDIIPRMRQDSFSAKCLVDTSGINSLNYIEDQGESIVLGALTSHQEIVESQLIQQINPALVEAAESIGCIQTRCRGTLGGNIANASPAGDTLPPLLVYDAQVLLQSLEGERILGLDEFLLGPGKIALKPGEFIHSISFEPLKGSWGSHFIKVGKRSGMAISVVNAAGAIVLDEKGLIADARLALGAVGPVVIRCRETEKSLIGKKPDLDLFQQVSELAQAEISPIRDIRSTDRYRAHAAGVIAGRVLRIAAERAAGRIV